MVKHASQSDAVVNGVTIPAAVGRAVTQETLKETVEERRDGNYRVRKVDTTVPDGFRVFVENLENQETFAVDVQEVMSSANDRVIIKRSGDVIPYVIGPVEGARSGSEQLITPPEICPFSGDMLIRPDGAVDLFCPNPKCPERVFRSLEFFVSRGAMDIDGMGPSNHYQ